MPTATAQADLPNTCPIEIVDLIKAVGSKAKAQKVLRAGWEPFRDVVAGTKPMPADWQDKITRFFVERAGVSPNDAVVAHVNDAPAPVQAGVPFVPWDGAVHAVTFPAARGQKKRVAKKCPVPIYELLSKHGMNISAACRDLGVSTGSLNPIIWATKPFADKLQRRVHAALHGTPEGAGVDDTDEPDRYTLDLAFVQLKATNYDRVNEVAELLNGRRVFRLHTPAGWLLVYRFKAEDARKFKRIALRDCQKIVCP